MADKHTHQWGGLGRIGDRVVRELLTVIISIIIGNSHYATHSLSAAFGADKEFFSNFPDNGN
jgi:hypothetical protein